MSAGHEENADYQYGYRKIQYGSNETYEYIFDSAKIDKLVVYGKNTRPSVANKIHIYQHNPKNIAFINLCTQNEIKFTDTFERVAIFATNEINIKKLLKLADIRTNAIIDICQNLGVEFPTLQELCIQPMILEIESVPKNPKSNITWQRNSVNRLERVISDAEILNTLRDVLANSSNVGVYATIFAINDLFASCKTTTQLQTGAAEGKHAAVISSSSKRKSIEQNDSQHLNALKESRKRARDYNKLASYL